MNNFEELVYNAMQSSLEGYAASVVDSIEFELKRELTTEEHQQVFVAVDRAITGIAVAQKELQDLRAQLESAQKERDVYAKLASDVGDIITLLQNNEWDEHIGKTNVGGLLEYQITRLMNSIADINTKLLAAEAALSAANERLKGEQVPVFEVEMSCGHWLNMGPISGADLSKLPDGINKLFTAPQKPVVLSSSTVMGRAYVVQAIKAAGGTVEGGDNG